jgi:hypothetical protein
VGSGGDFCSREHRNQFRLRQGMDRLMEANTVANLMRRRERPKTIVTTPMDSASSLERRSFAQGLPMPARAGILIKEMRVSSGRGNGLGQGRRSRVALVRFHVLGTEDARHGMSVSWRRTRGLFLVPKSRRGGMLATDRTAATAREIPAPALRGILLRVSGSAGFRPQGVQVRSVEPRHSTKAIRGGFRKAAGQPIARPAAIRSHGEQWSTLRTGLHIAEPGSPLYPPWSGLRPGFRGVWGSSTAAGAIPPGPGTARMAQVRIELQESVRYAISTEEDRP